MRAARGLEDDLARLNTKHARDLYVVSQRMVSELRTALLKNARRGGFRVARTRALLVRFTAISAALAARFERGVKASLVTLGTEAARLGRTALGRQLARSAALYPGLLDDLPRAREITGLLEPGLIERYSKHSRRWAAEQMRVMRQVMADGAAREETMEVTWKRMADTLGISEARSAVIVRTETSFAAHRRQVRDLVESGLADEMDKQLLATFDARTGEDSKFVHKQTRHLDEDFEDNEGRVYPHPPNRPNDREVMVFVPRGLP